MTRTTFALMSHILLSGSLKADDPKPTHDPGVPELAELERFTGTWQAQLGNSDATINSKRQWTLNGRFLKHDFDLSGGQVRGTIYRGYDQQNERYTLTFLDSQGDVSLLAGYWSEEQKLFTFDAVDRSCRVQHYESYFPSDGVEEWKITLSGDNTSEISGLTRRQSE